MSVDSSAPWLGSAYRHIPIHGDILNFEFAGMYGSNRWNFSGERTLYLAGDQGVLAAEWARHLPYPWTGNVLHRALTRQVYRIGARLDHVVDVRPPESLEQFEINPSSWALDMASTRDIARNVRDTTSAQAIIVPSIAFLDDHTRWNLVVFLDKVPERTDEWIVSVESIGLLRWESS